MFTPAGCRRNASSASRQPSQAALTTYPYRQARVFLWREACDPDVPEERRGKGKPLRAELLRGGQRLVFSQGKPKSSALLAVPRFVGLGREQFLDSTPRLNEEILFASIGVQPQYLTIRA